MVKIAPVSADLLLKLAILGAAAVALLYAVNRVSKTATAAAAWAGETADNVVQSLNPVNNKNVFYTGANYLTGGTASQSIGTRLNDWMNPAPPAALPPPRNTGGASGSW